MKDQSPVVAEIYEHMERTKQALEVSLQAWHDKNLSTEEAHQMALSSYQSCAQAVNAICSLIENHSDLPLSAMKIIKQNQARAFYALCVCSGYCNALSNHWAALNEKNQSPKNIAMFGQFVLHSIAQSNYHLASMNSIPVSPIPSTIAEEN